MAYMYQYQYNWTVSSQKLRRKDSSLRQHFRRKDPNIVGTSPKLRRAGELISQGLYYEKARSYHSYIQQRNTLLIREIAKACFTSKHTALHPNT